jgi:DNA-binding transcriptional MerR regulator
LKPLQRAGNRRYYRPGDVDLARRIHRLLTKDGYTVRGVQKLLRGKNGAGPGIADEPDPSAPNRPAERSQERPAIDLHRLVALRDRLASALDT